MDILLEHFGQEWRVVLDAPVAFFLCVLVMGVLTYVALDYIHRAKVGALEATIRLKESELGDAQRRIASMPLVSSETGVRESGAGPNTLPNAIRIVFRHEPEFLPEMAYHNGPVRRSIKVLLKNNGNGWLSTCLLEVISIAPKPTIANCEVLKALEPACVLNFGMSKSYTLAEFNRVEAEPRQSVHNDGPSIFFSAPGAYGGGAHTILSPDVRYLIRLRASCAECNPHEIDLRVWVDEGRILQADLV
jgi:hypothetical protein